VNFVPLVPIGNVAALQLGVDTWLYYQDSTGAIVQDGLTPGPFTTAHTLAVNHLIAPVNEALIGTPIVVTATPVGNSTNEVGVNFSLFMMLRLTHPFQGTCVLPVSQGCSQRIPMG
jgi:hypothetical protein